MGSPPHCIMSSSHLLQLVKVIHSTETDHVFGYFDFFINYLELNFQLCFMIIPYELAREH